MLYNDVFRLNSPNHLNVDPVASRSGVLEFAWWWQGIQGSFASDLGGFTCGARPVKVKDYKVLPGTAPA